MINIMSTIEDLYIRQYYNVELLNYLCFIMADNQLKRSALVVQALLVQVVRAPPVQVVLPAVRGVPRA